VSEALKESSFYTLKQLTNEQFEFLRGIVYKETGIKLSDLKRSLLQSRLMRRLRLYGFNEYQEYIDYLRDHYDDEIMDFINAITTNKTEFFRENQHFEYLKDIVFPELEKKNIRKLRIWSAGCSTGEEPYTLAMTVSEYFSDRIKDIKILATDIDTQVLEKGCSGIYTAEQVAGIDRGILQRHFSIGTGDNKGKFKIKDATRKLIVFKRLNLLDPEYPMRGKMNIIFCRNVVIYFDKPTQKTLFERMYDYLEDDGYLFVGHSENLSGITMKFQHIGKTIYRKVLPNE
jgi:chemotaxis protein methyltransferase CheR